MTAPLEKQKSNNRTFVSTTAREPLEVKLLLTESQRVTINQHAEFRDSITPQPPFDEIDEMIDPYAGDPPNRRSDKETSRLLSLLDELDTGRGKH